MAAIYHFTPSKMTPAGLKSMFVSKKGKSIFDRIIKDLRRRIGKASNQHYLVLGPRGIGKSHLLANVYYTVKETRALNSHWVPLWFSEEEYAVISIRDLADRILEEIIREFSTANKTIAGDVQSFKNGMELKEENEEVFNLTTAFINDLSESLGKRFIVIIENFNLFLKDISSYEEKKLRALLMNETSLLFIASAPTLHSYLTEVADPRHALFSFFDVHHLDEFSLNECMELLEQQCLQDNNAKLYNTLKKEENKLKTIHRLTGGNPRLMLMFYQLASSVVSLPEIETMLSQLLEELTPYFQSRTESLSSQQRKILITFAQSMENLTPAEVGKRIHLPTNQVTAQLKKLVEYGFLGIVAKEGKKRGTLYELSERIYRYWYQSRTGRGRSVIAGLVEFISYWFSIDELFNLKIEWVNKLNLCDDLNDREAALKRLEYIDHGIKEKERKYNDYMNDGCEAFKNGMLEMSILLFSKASDIMPDEAIPYYNKGVSFSSLGIQEEAIKYFDKAIGISNFPEAYCVKGITLYRLNRHEEAFQCFHKVIELKPDYINAYNDMGGLLTLEGKYDEAIKLHEMAIEIRPGLPHAYYNKAAALALMGRQEEAIESYNKVIELDPGNFKPYFWLSICELNLNKKTDSLYHFEKGLELFFKKRMKNDIFLLAKYVSDAVKTKDYKFSGTVVETIEKKKLEISNNPLEADIGGIVKYSKILIDFLKTGDRNILDRQPVEIRKTLKEMIDSIKKPKKIRRT